MKTAWIVKHLNVFEHLRFGLLSGGVSLVLNKLNFQGVKEAFDHRVVITTTFC